MPKKLSVVTHHWSNNEKKGFDIYRKIDQLIEDKMLDIDFTYIGRLPDDFRYKNIIRDTKTSTITPNAITRSHARQLALYSKAFPECECWIDYITPNKSTSYKLTDINQKFVEIQDIVFGLRKFFSISNDTLELASMLYPNLDSWMWNDEMINEAKRIWRI